MFSNTMTGRKAAVTVFVVLVGWLLPACGGGGSAVRSDLATTVPMADFSVDDALPVPGVNSLLDSLEPGREVSTVRNAADFRSDMPSAWVAPADDIMLDLIPNWDRNADPPLSDLAYCCYTFNVGDYSGPASLSVNWTYPPLLYSEVWLGFADRANARWNWLHCPSGNLLSLDSIDPYTSPSGDVLLAVVMTGVLGARLQSLMLDAGNNILPAADLVITPGTAQINTPVTFDAGASTDEDGIIELYEWDFDGNGAFDQTSSEATVQHSFTETGDYTAEVRVTDNCGGTDTATAAAHIVGSYDEVEDNDDGNRDETTPLDLAYANPLPVIEFSAFTGNCGANGYDGDEEDFFSVNITATGWMTFIMYHSDDDADLELQLIQDNGDGTSTTLVTKASTSDNEIINYEFTETGTFYLRVYLFSGAPEDAVADFSLEAKAGDFELPIASFTATPAEGALPLFVNFDGSASSDSDGTIVLYEWDYDGDGSYDYSSATPLASHTYTDPSSNAVKLRVTDDDGLTGSTTRTVRALGQPPVADLQADITSGPAPLRVNLSASASTDPENDIVQFKWDLDGNGSFEVDGGDSPYYTHDFTHGGTLPIGLQVIDASGSTDEDTVDITCFNDPPTASLTASPLAGDTPLTATLDASASTDPNGDIIAYHWDFDNDGTSDATSEEPTYDFTFYMHGSYTVAVEVEDGAGQTDSDTVNITVNAAYSETEPNNIFEEADNLPALPFSGWNGVVGPQSGPSADYEDWSSFTISSPGEINIYMQLHDDWGDIDMALFDTDGSTELEDSTGVNDDEEITWQLDNPGTYFLQIYMWNNDEVSTGGYLVQGSFTPD